MKCSNCNKHEASTIPWVGDGGMMGYVHGAYTYWCDCCMLKVQIKHAQNAIINLEKLKNKFNRLKCK